MILKFYRLWKMTTEGQVWPASAGPVCEEPERPRATTFLAGGGVEVSTLVVQRFRANHLFAGPA